MARRLLVIAIATAMAVFAAGCGAKDSGGAPDAVVQPGEDADPEAEEPGEVDEPGPEEAAGEEPGEDPGAAEGTEGEPAQPEVDCTPSCDGKVCGDDGCGGSCGGCDAGLECLAGQCKPACSGGKGFEPKVHTTSWKPMYKVGDPRGQFVRIDADSETYPVTTLKLEIRQHAPWNGPQGPGTYKIEGSSYQDCVICLTLADTCGQEGCVRRYLATDGTIEIKQMNGADGAFEAVLHGVVMSEAKITADLQQGLYTTTLVKKGKVWCLDGYEMKSDDPTLLVPEPGCVKEGTGTLQDQNIADFKLQTCNGNYRSLHSSCGKDKVIWMILVANWCPACKEWTPIAMDFNQKYSATSKIWHIVGEDLQGNTPDLEECKWYADQFGLSYDETFIDPGWQTVMKYIYPYGFQGIPYNIVLDGDNMAYVWSDGLMGGIGPLIGYLAKN